MQLGAVGAASGLKGIPAYTNLFWAWGLAAVTVFTVGCLVHSTYGRGFIAVHDDEVAAGAVGINPTRYKVTSFVIAAVRSSHSMASKGWTEPSV